MSLRVGEVIEVRGTKILLRVFEETSKDTLFYDGTKYKGISIREHLTIQRGFRDIVCIVEGEYLDESRFEQKNSKTSYIRKVEAKPIGYFQDGQFYEGIKYLPMIKDPAFLISENKIAQIYGASVEGAFIIGKMLKEDIPISLPWHKLFNTHIGIFGNTGSGKSNTLAKLYTTLFGQKLDHIRGKSSFILLDFNGEYTKEQLITKNDKQVFNLTTRADNGDKFPLAEKEYWNTETLCVLFRATPNTQQPFINRLLSGRERYNQNSDSLAVYLRSTFKKVFTTTSPKRESIELLKKIMQVINDESLREKLGGISWHGKSENFYISSSSEYFNGDEALYNQNFEQEVNKVDVSQLDAFNELIVRASLQLINDLLSGYVQFEYIQPLLKRIEASLLSLRRVINVVNEQPNEAAKLLTVISLRKCNQETKRLIPLLLAKHYYEAHKEENHNADILKKTIHLVIDEAHNILSQQSTREHESWKDYRLELFEEIIKEGRKFGVFLTLASQRPADISPTIMSQIHNFFIHRLVNDKDLLLLDNTVSTLDRLSKSMIPCLAKGCCIITGTSFDLPILVQVEQVIKQSRPDSEDVDLLELWSSDSS